MIDSITVINQVEELQILINKIHAEGMMINEAFQVASIIEKLPPLWKDFKNYLKHKCKELSMEDLIVRLRIEENSRKNDKYVGKSFMEAKAHIVEGECSKKRKLPFNNGKRKKPANNKPDNKKIKGACWVCRKSGIVPRIVGDSCPIGVSADSCPAGAPWMRE
ncbi:hypothetical protein CK203_052359 [Vitis vinifera]|uniref:Retrovirus-related Pol polyprotein from transposon TNT 1-94 n=1 Tax=Vitis vinifera TaxID=29760 RepID=A0A438H2S1_VITVI|nr:hypothetical protein CK203_052359 [Vitis vinifera]